MRNCPQALKRPLSALTDENKGRRIHQRPFSCWHKGQTEPSCTPVPPTVHGLVPQHQAEPQPPRATLKGSLWPCLLRPDPAPPVSALGPCLGQDPAHKCFCDFLTGCSHALVCSVTETRAEIPQRSIRMKPGAPGMCRFFLG